MTHGDPEGVVFVGDGLEEAGIWLRAGHHQTGKLGVQVQSNSLLGPPQVLDDARGLDMEHLDGYK